MKNKLSVNDFDANSSPVCFQNSSEVRDEYHQ